MDKKVRKWYQKKRYITGLVVLGLFIIGSFSGDSSSTTPQIQPQTANVLQGSAVVETQTKTVPSVVEIKTETPAVTPQQPTVVKESGSQTTVTQEKTTQTQSGSNLSNDNYYTNSVGNTVHSPAYSIDGSVPAGATAQCRDGTYSFSQSRRGTCSGHGGVARWLY